MTVTEEVIVAKLKEEQESLRRTVAAAQRRVGQLQCAVDAIEGKDPAPPGERERPREEGPSVADMVLGAAKELRRKLGAGTAADYATLVAEASRLNPGKHSVVKRGVYTAVATLQKRGALVRAPGGWALSERESSLIRAEGV